MITLSIIAAVAALKILEFKLRLYSYIISLLLRCIYGLLVFIGIILLAVCGFR